MYAFNVRPENFEIKDYDRKNPPPSRGGWTCGGRKRRQLNLAYSIAFTCLLRIDEVLRIEHHHIQLRPDRTSLKLTLDYRKTAQFGRMFPIFLKLYLKNIQVLFYSSCI